MSDTFQTRAVVLGAPELVFRSFNHWVAKARQMYEQTGLLESDLVALDTRGRVCRRGAHFKRAHDEDAYPVIVYRAEPGATQGEAMVYATLRSVDRTVWQVTTCETLLRNPKLRTDEGEPMLLVDLFIATSFDEAKARLERLREGLS